MGNCFVDMSHPMYGYNAQDKNDKIIVAVSEEIRPCVRFKTSKYLSIDAGTLVQFVRRDVPEDQLNCEPIKCLNTGTLYIDAVDNKAKVKYQLRSDADDYALGFNFIYLKIPQAGKYRLKATVSDYYNTAQTDAYVYTYEFTVGAPGYVVRTIDFSDSRVMTQIGNGWQVSDFGITIAYELEYISEEPALTMTQFGFSTGMIVNDRSELRKFANVMLSCLNSFTHNVSVSATDARCFGRQYDPNQVEITKEITATTASCNDYWLNPLHTMTKVMSSGIPVTDEFIVERAMYEGKEYGKLVLPDLYYGDCNTITISSDRCKCTYLSSLPISTGISLEDDEFVLLSQEHHFQERGTIFVNPMYIGEKLLVTYNAERDVELIVANDKRLNKTRFRVTQKVTNTRGVDEYYVFKNVLITENSREFTSESETTLSLTLTISRDAEGNFYEIRRNIEDVA